MWPCGDLVGWCGGVAARRRGGVMVGGAVRCGAVRCGAVWFGVVQDVAASLKLKRSPAQSTAILFMSTLCMECMEWYGVVVWWCDGVVAWWCGLKWYGVVQCGKV